MAHSRTFHRKERRCKGCGAILRAKASQRRGRCARCDTLSDPGILSSRVRQPGRVSPRRKGFHPLRPGAALFWQHRRPDMTVACPNQWVRPGTVCATCGRQRLVNGTPSVGASGYVRGTTPADQEAQLDDLNVETLTG